MALGVEGMPAGKVARKVILLTLGTALFAASLTAVFSSMRSVMDIGGSCVSGGPYTSAVRCPDGAWLTPVGIFVGLGACVLMVAGAFSGAGPQPVVFAWSALFLALGWNFWDYGLDPPGDGGVDVGWIICGVLFVLMGGLPLMAIMKNLRGVLWGGPAPPAIPGSVRRLSPGAARRERAKASDASAAPGRPTDWPPPLAKPAPAGTLEERQRDHVVARLERLSVLFRRGDLTVEEYQAATSAVLAHEHGDEEDDR